MPNPRSPNWSVPTAPSGTSDNRAASTQFVASSVSTRGYGAFQVNLGVNQAVGTGFTKVAFDTVMFDVNSTFDAANHKWVPGQLGYYLVGLSVDASQSPANGTQEAYLYLNGTAYAYGTFQSLNDTVVVTTVTAMMQINTNTDFVEGYVLSGAAGTALTNSPSVGTFMYGFRVV